METIEKTTTSSLNEKFKTKPYKHQLDCLNKFGRKEAFALLAEMGTGKAQPVSSLVMTPSGWKQIGSLCVGDSLFSVDGSLSKVTGVFPQGKKEVMKITLGDGGSTLCCKEHLWLTASSKERQAAKKVGVFGIVNQGSVKSLEAIMKRTHDAAGNAIHQIPVHDELQFLHSDVSIDAYTLGVLLGDGCLRTACSFTNSNQFIVDEIKRKLPSTLSLISVQNSHSISRVNGSAQENCYTKELKKLGIFGKYSFEKFIPEKYKWNSKKISLAVLQGLMDTDGTVENGCAVFSTASSKLAHDVAEIVRNLGGVARIKNRKNCGYFKDGEKIPCRDGFVVRINLPKEKVPFRLPRKLNLYKPSKKYLPTQRTIKTIERHGEVECVCISIDHPSELYITDCNIVTHNTKIIIDNVADLWSSGDCDGVLIFAPNGVHTNWTRLEFPKHFPDWVRYKAAAFCSGGNKREKAELESLYDNYGDGVLRIMTMNWESLQHKTGVQAAERFAGCFRRLMIVCDESDSAKNPKAERTKALMKLKKFSHWRRIMSGTPINNSPFDAFSQFSFLDESILGTTSFYAFKAEYSELLSENHHLLQHIVRKRIKFDPKKKASLNQSVFELQKLISQNGRDELLIAMASVIDANESESYESLSRNLTHLVSLFSPAPSAGKSKALRFVNSINASLADYLKQVSSAFNPNRLPQIVDKDKEGKPKYRNLDKLSALIAPHSFRVLKSECLDLPEKIHKTLVFSMTKEQIEVYKKAEDECRIVFEGQETPFTKLVAVTKLAQITSGYYIHPLSEEPVRIEGGNPKLDILVDRVNKIVESGEKVIVWARYKIEIKDIVARLEEEGHTVVQYHGEIKKGERVEAIEAFERGEATVFVGNQNAGGTGITLVAASYVIYFSNNFSLRARLQSEDRAHRIGQVKNVTYINIAARGTIDEAVIEALLTKKDIADTIIDKGLKLFS